MHLGAQYSGLVNDSHWRDYFEPHTQAPIMLNEISKNFLISG